GAPRARNRRGVSVRRQRRRPAGHRRAPRLLPPLRRSREVQSAVRPGGTDQEARRELAGDGVGHRGARRAGRRLVPLRPEPAMTRKLGRRREGEATRRPGEVVCETIPPTDGRNIDPEIGTLDGEGALQRVRELNAPPHGEANWFGPPPSDVPDTPVPSYYGVPALKEPVWKWYIPAYFYAGGVAGASAVLGAAAGWMDGNPMRTLSRRCRLIAAGGAAASAALLIADLGRPARFLNMLRVFRPSSPMNLGTWILSAFGACAGLAALPAVIRVPKTVRRAGDAASLGAGIVGLPLTAYTGVLLAGTAVPLWQGARRELPILFACSSAAAAASLLDLFPDRAPASIALHR